MDILCSAFAHNIFAISTVSSCLFASISICPQFVHSLFIVVPHNEVPNIANFKVSYEPKITKSARFKGLGAQCDFPKFQLLLLGYDHQYFKSTNSKVLFMKLYLPRMASLTSQVWGLN